MSNFFKKISSGASNVFKKIDKGSDNLFKKVSSGTSKVINSVHDGIDTGLRGANGVLKQVGNGLEKYSPLIEAGAAAFAPEFAIPIAAGLESAKAFTNNSRQLIKQGRGMNNELGQIMQNKSTAVLGQAQQKFGNLSSGLAGQVQNRIGQGQSMYNQGMGYVNQGQGLVKQGQKLFNQGPANFKSQAQGFANNAMSKMQEHLQNQAANLSIH